MSYAIIKYRNSDFQVSEVSLLPVDLSFSPSDKRHTIIRTEKEGYTTFEALYIIAKFFDVDVRSVHCEGLKDEDGITSQTMSVELLLGGRQITEFNEQNAGKNRWIRVTLQGFSSQPVKEKRLHGNTFTLTLRNLEKDQAARLSSHINDQADFFFGNYYDSQRFGLPGGPYVAHLIGRSIVSGDWQTAELLYKESGNVKLDFAGLPLEKVTLRALDVRKLNFFLSAYSGYLWNNELSQLFPAPRNLKIFDGFEVAPFLLGTALPSGVSLVHSRSYRLNDDFEVMEERKERRSIIQTKLFADEPSEDTYHAHKYALNLQFFLPTGSYATMLVQHLLVATT